MNVKAKLVSPNDWLKRAGAYIDGENVVLPHKFLLVPMTLASEAILEFRKHENIGSKIKFAIVVVTMVRIADTVFYNKLVKLLNEANPSVPNLCQHCIRGQICDTKMKAYRQFANKNIIHKMENDEFINFEDLEVVENYYSELFKLPLMDPISFPERKNLKLCGNCKKKWKNITNRSS